MHCSPRCQSLSKAKNRVWSDVSQGVVHSWEYRGRHCLFLEASPFFLNLGPNPSLPSSELASFDHDSDRGGQRSRPTPDEESVLQHNPWNLSKHKCHGTDKVHVKFSRPTGKHNIPDVHITVVVLEEPQPACTDFFDNGHKHGSTFFVVCVWDDVQGTQAALQAPRVLPQLSDESARHIWKWWDVVATLQRTNALLQMSD